MLGDEYQDAVPSYGNLEVRIIDEVKHQFPQLCNIVELYWERELTPEGLVRFSRPAQSIAQIGGLGSGQISKLVKLVSRVTLKDLKCSNCGRDRQAINRTSYHDAIKAHVREEACLLCTLDLPYSELDENLSVTEWEKLSKIARHVEERVTREREAREREDEELTAVRRMSVANPPELPSVEELGFRHAVALLALGRACMKEDFSGFTSLSSSPDQFAPTSDMSFALFEGLLERGIIGIDPDSSPLDAFKFETEVSSSSVRVSIFYPLRAATILARGSLSYLDTSAEGGEDWLERDGVDVLSAYRRERTRLYFRELEEALDASGTWPPLWAIMWEDNDWHSLWKEISLNECLAYLELVLREHGLPFRAGDKTRFVLSGILENFSVAQTWGMVWRAGRDAAAFYMRRGSTRGHAANTVVGSIQRQAERALSEGWNLQAFRRDRRLPRSTISEVFFAKALKIGDGGFNRVVPHEDTSLDNLPSVLATEGPAH